MMTKQEFLEREFVHQLQKALWQYELEGISTNELIEVLTAIVAQYDVKTDTIVFNSEIQNLYNKPKKIKPLIRAVS
jgi:hypothetical protein